VGYKIKYSRSDGHGKTLSHVVQDRVEREYTIEDLEEWTEYRVQVQAFNAIGSGPWSQMVVGRTRESGTALSLCPQGHPIEQEVLNCTQGCFQRQPEQLLLCLEHCREPCHIAISPRPPVPAPPL
jgi:hypothetical protein